MAWSRSGDSVPSRCSVTSSTNSRQATTRTGSPPGAVAGRSGTVISVLLLPVHVLEPGAQSRATAVQQDALVGRAQFEPVADLVGGEAVDVAQLDDRPLPLRELRQGVRQLPAQFGCHGGVLGWWVPRRRSAGDRPSARPPVLRSPEPPGIDGGPALDRLPWFGERRRPRQGACLALPPGPGQVLQ